MLKCSSSLSVAPSERRLYLCDHFASGLGSFSVRGPLPLERDHPLSGGSILQSELADEATESCDFNVSDRRGWLTQEQQEGVEPAGSGGARHQAVAWKHNEGRTHLLMTRLWTTFRMRILWVQSFRNSVILFFCAVLVSCLATTFRLSHEALQRFSSWTRFSESSSKSTCRKKTERSPPTGHLNRPRQRTKLYFGRSGDGGDLRVQVGGFWVILHHLVAGVMQQGLAMDRVLHLHHLLQVTQLKAFGLDTDAGVKAVVSLNRFCSSSVSTSWPLESSCCLYV